MPQRPVAAAAPQEAIDLPPRYSPKASSDDSLLAIREQLHWLFLLALIPLAISIVFPGKPFEERLSEAIPDLETRAEIEEKAQRMDPFSAIASVFPDNRLPDAHLPRNSLFHWVYAFCSALFFSACLLAMLPSSKSSLPAIGGIALLTGTIGIFVLLGFQLLAALTQGAWFTNGHVVFLLIFYVIKFIGFSYQCAIDPSTGFLLSFVGFTCGVGLCEEIVKAAPVIIYCREVKDADWRAVCLVGLASGIGFGISEGITYSGDFYNGIQPGLIYAVRFLSCVALHAIWSGSVAMLVYSNRDLTNAPITLETVGLWIGSFLIVPMLLHGLYDTLLKEEMPIWALLIAAASFGWFAYLVRHRQTEFGFA